MNATRESNLGAEIWQFNSQLGAMRQRRFTSNVLRRVFDAIPGKKTLGVYRFLPFFFFLGATLEFSMINWTVGDTNFCKGIEHNP